MQNSPQNHLEKLAKAAFVIAITASGISCSNGATAKAADPKSETVKATPSPAAMACSALANQNFELGADAPIRVVSAEYIENAEVDPQEAKFFLKRSQSQGAPMGLITHLPDHCRVEGYVAPAVGFLMYLPAPEKWNDKVIVSACDAFCGATEDNMPIPGLVRDYAAITTDGGHRGKRPFDGTWAYNNMQGKIDFGYRAVHLTLQTGETLAKAYYGSDSKYAYLTGFSKGGTAGIKSALVYPNDFDGILSRAPVVEYQTVNTIRLPWIHTSNLDESGNPILNSSHMAFIHKAVTDACDDIDGIVDGVIDDPRLCTFDTTSLICESGVTDTSTCLSATEADALDKFYAAPKNADGSIAYPFGMDYGSEMKWAPFNVPMKGSDFTFSLMGGNQYLKYMAFNKDSKTHGGPGYDWLKFDYATDADLLEDMKYIMDADDPDLSKFKASGNKLIVTHGWADPAISASMSVRWYKNVLKTVGNTDDYLRLFLMPGVAHGSGGPGPDIYDALSALENWVEKGEAPDQLIMSEDVDGKITRTRPVYPYPLKAKYKGTGSTDEAENFGPLDSYK